MRRGHRTRKAEAADSRQRAHRRARARRIARRSSGSRGRSRCCRRAVRAARQPGPSADAVSLARGSWCTAGPHFMVKRPARTAARAGLDGGGAAARSRVPAALGFRWREIGRHAASAPRRRALGAEAVAAGAAIDLGRQRRHARSRAPSGSVGGGQVEPASRARLGEGDAPPGCARPTRRPPARPAARRRGGRSRSAAHTSRA